ncbi:restriction endonuclease subunit S, partial [Psychrobacter celer]
MTTTGLPEGWKYKTFADIVDINPKTSIKKGVVAPFVPMSSISTSSMIIDPIEERAVSGGTKFKNGDTLFARITPCLENGKTGL